jgi:hypothetical protein
MLADYRPSCREEAEYYAVWIPLQDKNAYNLTPKGCYNCLNELLFLR